MVSQNLGFQMAGQLVCRYATGSGAGVIAALEAGKEDRARQSRIESRKASRESSSVRYDAWGNVIKPKLRDSTGAARPGQRESLGAMNAGSDDEDIGQLSDSDYGGGDSDGEESGGGSRAQSRLSGGGSHRRLGDPSLVSRAESRAASRAGSPGEGARRVSVNRRRVSIREYIGGGGGREVSWEGGGGDGASGDAGRRRRSVVGAAQAESSLTHSA
jgi:hypothetical protein